MSWATSDIDAALHAHYLKFHLKIIIIIFFEINKQLA